MFEIGILVPCYPFIPACLVLYVTYWKSYSTMFCYRKRAEGATSLPQPVVRHQPSPHRPAIANHEISSSSPKHRKSSKVIPKPWKTSENDTEINRSPTYGKIKFLCHTPPTKCLILEPQTSRSRPRNHYKTWPVNTCNKKHICCANSKQKLSKWNPETHPKSTSSKPWPQCLPSCALKSPWIARWSPKVPKQTQRACQITRVGHQNWQHSRSESLWFVKHVTSKLDPDTSEAAQVSVEKFKNESRKQQAKARGPAAWAKHSDMIMDTHN